jgi:preprotein translocase subunit SecG
VIEVIVCLFLILIILMQRPRQEGLGAAFGGGVTDQMFGAQTTNVLQKFTGYLAAALFILTLVLAVLTTKMQRAKMADGKKMFEAPPAAVAPATPAATTPAAVPAADGKTISVTKQPGATVVVKQPDGKPAAPAEKTDAKPAPAEKTDAKPADAAPQTKPAAPATTPPAPKPATPPAAATPPASSTAPAAPAPVPAKP